MNYRIILLAILGIDALILLFQTSTISISTHEAKLLYGDFSFIQVIEKLSLILFGQNDLALRFPMMFFHLLSTLLLYAISKNYLKDDRNRIWLILVFLLLPGIVSSALLVDSAGFIIFGLLLFVYIYKNYLSVYSYALLLLLSLLDGGFIYLCFSLIFYSIYKKNRNLLIFSILTFITSFYIYGIEANGTPKGHFLDALGLYSAVLTPIIFIYLFYILYRKLLSKDLEIIWFISAIPLLLSLLLSFRQNIFIENYAPYLIIALPLAAQTFYATYRVRLKMFRGRYKTIFVLSLLFLLFNFVVVLYNRELYLFIENPDKHFARKMHIAKELAQELKNRDIKCVKTRETMALRLKFYGIENCKENMLKEVDLNDIREESVTISYKNRLIYNATVTKINNK